MSLEFWGMSIEGIAMAVAVSIFIAELVGYVLHRLMHGERFPSMSRAHMIHHLERYGPTKSMRSAAYKNATGGRAALGNIGMEWVLPSGAVVVVVSAVMWALHVGWKYELLVIAGDRRLADAHVQLPA
jgi:sterol desaturase/sphingolipid hydroxylase (fatty acid hydroxylase superfamily)